MLCRPLSRHYWLRFEDLVLSQYTSGEKEECRVVWLKIIMRIYREGEGFTNSPRPPRDTCFGFLVGISFKHKSTNKAL